jgi:hypothetical protein
MPVALDVRVATRAPASLFFAKPRTRGRGTLVAFA